MKITIVKDKDLELFANMGDEFGSIFSNSHWVKLFGNDLLRLGIYEGDGKLIGGLYLYRKKILGKNYFKCCPFSPHIDIFYNKKVLNNSKKNTFIKQLSAELVSFFYKEKFLLFNIAFNPEVKDLQPFLWSKYKASLQYTYQLDLKCDFDDIEKGYSPERRNDIKKAIRDGLKVEILKDKNILIGLIEKTFKRQEKSVDVEFIKKILLNFSNDRNSYTLVVKDKLGRAISSCFFVYDKNTAYYLLSGYDTQLKHHGAGALCVSEGIQYAKKLGLRTFDFEGSMQPQIEKYFRGFGGKLLPYFTVHKSYFFLEVILKLKKREIF